jgi:hypothetical protein
MHQHFGLVAADLWLCVCIVSAAELGHISISCAFCILPYCCIEALFPDSEGQHLAERIEGSVRYAESKR